LLLNPLNVIQAIADRAANVACDATLPDGRARAILDGLFDAVQAVVELAEDEADNAVEATVDAIMAADNSGVVDGRCIVCGQFHPHH
jgi:hypothetical protein